MRHLGSLIAGLLAAPALWLLLALGQPRTAATITRWVDHDSYQTVDLLGPVAYVAAAGLLLGLVACLRISPAGPLAAGLAYAALYGALFVDPLRVMDAIPKNTDLGPVDAQLRIPVVNGTLALLAVCLLVALASGGRWRRWPTAVQPAEAEGLAGPLAAGPVSPGSVPQSPASPGLAPLGPVPPLPTRTPRQQAPAPEPSAAPTMPILSKSPAAPTPSESPTTPTLSEPPTMRAVPEPPTAPTSPVEPTVSLPADGLAADTFAADSASQPSTVPPPWPPPADATATRVPAEAEDAADLGPSDQPQQGGPDSDETPPASPWAVPPRAPRW